MSKRSRLLVSDGDHVEVGTQLVAGCGRPEAGPAHPRPACGADAPGRRGPGRLPPAGCVDPRQAHRGHRPADAAPRDDHRVRRRRPAARRARRAGSLRGREPARGRRGRQAGLGSSRAHGHHQGLAGDRVVAVGGLLPGDDPGAHRGGDPRQVRPAARPQGERHPRQAHPGRHRSSPVPQHQGRAHRGGQGRDVLDAGYEEIDFPAFGPGSGEAIRLDDATLGFDRDYRRRTAPSGRLPDGTGPWPVRSGAAARSRGSGRHRHRGPACVVLGDLAAHRAAGNLDNCARAPPSAGTRILTARPRRGGGRGSPLPPGSRPARGRGGEEVRGGETRATLPTAGVEQVTQGVRGPDGRLS